MVTLPLVALGEGSLAVPATASSLVDWLLLTGLVELLLGLPQRGGSQPGSLGRAPDGTLPRQTFLAGTGGLLGVISLGYLGFNVLSAVSPPGSVSFASAPAFSSSSSDQRSPMPFAKPP